MRFSFFNFLDGVIPQDRTNSIRYVACEFVYAESPFCANWRFRIVEQYYAPRSVSRYCSNLRNDIFLFFLIKSHITD